MIVKINVYTNDWARQQVDAHIRICCLGKHTHVLLLI